MWRLPECSVTPLRSTVGPSGQRTPAGSRTPARLRPELNAARGNLAGRDVDQLTAIVKNRLESIQYRPTLIEGFLAQTGFTFEPEPPDDRPWPFNLCCWPRR